MKLRGVLFSMVLGFGLALSACSRESADDSTSNAGVSTSAISDLGQLELHFPTSELRTVDQLPVSITLTRKSGIVTGDLNFDPASSGWTVANQHATPPRVLDDGRVRQDWSFTLEPFLAGDYEVPAASIELSEAGQQTKLATQAEPVTVTSVLPADEQVQLAEPKPLAEPPAPVDRRPRVLAIVASLVVLILATAAVLIGRRRIRRRAQPQIDPPFATDPRARAGCLRRRIIEFARLDEPSLTSQPSNDQLRSALDARMPADKARELAAILARLDEMQYGPVEPIAGEVDAIETRLAAAITSPILQEAAN